MGHLENPRELGLLDPAFAGCKPLMVGSLTVTSMDASPLAVAHSWNDVSKKTVRLNVFLGG